ncbi:MAG: TIGR02996 domain-containing protein [Kofleriaceae bacterium]
MASVLAIVSKAIFDKEARGKTIGDVWPTKLYASHNKGLAKLEGGGDLYLVTVRGNELWLVAKLEAPSETKAGWTATENATPIRAIGTKFEFVDGAPLPKDFAKLGMSLQTPRVLSDTDIAGLEGGDGRNYVNLRSPSPRKSARAGTVATTSTKPIPAKSAKARSVDASTLAKAIAEGRNGDALEEALAIWAVQPSAELSQIITGLSTVTRTDVPNIGGKGKNAVAAWTAAAKSASLTERPSLLDRLGDASSGDAGDRIMVVARWLPDPRVEAALVAMLEAPPFSATSTKPFWTKLFALLKDLKDPTLRERVAKTAELIKKGVAATMAEWMIAQLGKIVPAIDAQLAAIPPASADIAQLASNAQTLGKDPELEALLAAVYADPASDAPRLVYADALAERGDPRGELITIQMRLADTPNDKQLRAREKELLDAHAETWLGPVARWAKGRFTFEKGFLATVDVSDPSTKGSARSGELVGLPIWATVHTLTGALVLARDPAFKALRDYRLADDSQEQLVAFLTDAKLPNLEALYIHTGWRDERPPIQKALLECKPFPKLKSLTVVESDRTFLEKLATSAIGRRLDKLGFRFEVDENRPWANDLTAIWKAAPVPTLEVTVYYATWWEQVYTFTRSDGKYTGAHVVMGSVTGSEHWGQLYVGDALATLRAVRTLEALDYDIKRSLADDQKKRLEREVKKLELDRVKIG